jgi:sterol desaturase/sphingolipid hydroxylase (fatty acid hydroxylase superfamily)
MTLNEDPPMAEPLVPAPGSKKSRSTGDTVASIVLVLVAVFVNLGISFAGFMLVMMSDGCRDTCDVGALTGGVIIASVAPSVVTVMGIIVTIVLVVRRRLAFWVPIATVGAQVIALAIGALIVFGSIGSF